MDIGSIIDAIVDALYDIFAFIVGHPLYIALILTAIIIYAVASHVFFKVKGYQPVDRAMCSLSIAGKERSLEYLQNFTHMTPAQIAVIKYMRKNEPVARSTLNKRFGKRAVDILIYQEYIVLT